MAKELLDERCQEAVQELAQELDLYRRIVETASDAVVTINQNHEVVYMNQAAERLFGYRRSEILGGDLSPLIPSEHRANHRHYVERYVRTRRPRMIGHVAQVEAERRDGTRIPISISFSVAESDDGLLFTAIMRDRSAEQHLVEQVKKAEKLAAVGQIVATVSHEIRTPLALIGGFAGQLMKERGLSERGRRKLAIIVDEVSRLERLLNELNDLSRPQRYEWEELDVGTVADHVRELMGPKLEHDRFRLKVQKPSQLPLVTADRNRLSQVLINLVNNAVQASQPGDEISIHLGPTDDGGVWLEVRDQGQGIPQDHMDRLFEPFFTTKKRGTGLGLPLAKRIVEEHGGTIQVSSQPQKGTCVRVVLPPSSLTPQA
jgi:PAS domain S-box-containing protein